jgi:hypothetical protein
LGFFWQRGARSNIAKLDGNKFDSANPNLAERGLVASGRILV